jgi:hypothetical protein
MKSRWWIPALCGLAIVCLALIRTRRTASHPGEADGQPEGTPVADFLSKPPGERGRPSGSPGSGSHDLIQRILSALKTGDSADHDRAIHEWLPELIRIDPSAAAHLAESLERGPLRDEMMRRVIQHWTGSEPDRARQWAESLPEVHERRSVLTDFCYQVAQSDPAQATQLAGRMELGDFGGPAVENLVQQWALKDPSSALNWALARDPGEGRDQMLSRVALVLAKTSPADAANMVVKEIPAGDAQSEAVISVLSQWGRSDPKGAQAWAELFPEGPLRDRAMNELQVDAH